MPAWRFGTREVAAKQCDCTRIGMAKDGVGGRGFEAALGFPGGVKASPSTSSHGNSRRKLDPFNHLVGNYLAARLGNRLAAGQDGLLRHRDDLDAADLGDEFFDVFHRINGGAGELCDF